MLLAIKNKGEVLPLLLSQPCYVKGPDTTSPLYAAASYWAADNGHTEIVNMLLAVHLENDPLPLLLNDDYIIELRGTGQFKDTPLHTAAQRGHLGIVKALVGNPLHVQQFSKYWTNGFNQTPLECAKNYPDIQEIISQSLTQ